jgi:hypothetical protein
MRKNSKCKKRLNQWFKKWSEVITLGVLRGKKVAVVTAGEDLNAKIGKEQAYSLVSRVHTLQNGEMVCNFAIQNNMIIMSTQYQHISIHKCTWTTPEGATVNQIDHVLINANKRSVVEDIRSMQELNCNSGHFLVKTANK